MTIRAWLTARLAGAISRAKATSGIIDRKAENIAEKIGDGLIAELADRLPGLFDTDLPILNEDQRAVFESRLRDELPMTDLSSN